MTASADRGCCDLAPDAVPRLRSQELKASDVPCIDLFARGPERARVERSRVTPHHRRRLALTRASGALRQRTGQLTRLPWRSPPYWPANPISNSTSGYAGRTQFSL